MDYFINSFFVTVGILSGLVATLAVLALAGTILSLFQKK